MRVVLLAGGTGGAKLARGLRDLCDLTVIANTGDDVEIHSAHVSPDPDLVLFWLADRIDARGWGLEGDTFHAMDRLRARGVDVWFNLGDEDLEIGRDRLRRLRAGERLTEAIDALRVTLGARALVRPMCDEPVRTFVGGIAFQEWMIRHRGADPGPIVFEGIEAARVTPEVRAAVEAADAVVVGPSNPVLSIGPILAVPGMRELLASRTVTVVSPFVRGEVLKGPTAPCLRAAGVSADLAGALAFYGDVVDRVVADEGTALPTHVCDVSMADGAGRERLARDVLAFAP